LLELIESGCAEGSQIQENHEFQRLPASAWLRLGVPVGTHSAARDPRRAGREFLLPLRQKILPPLEHPAHTQTYRQRRYAPTSLHRAFVACVITRQQRAEENFCAPRAHVALTAQFAFTLY
jgi:hypothetical protein